MNLTLDFTNTEIAFSDKTDKELRKTARLFWLMNNPALVNVGSSMGLAAIKLHVPFSERIIKSTIFEQFCGGETLRDSQRSIDRLFKLNTLTVLDYGAESKSEESDLDNTLEEIVHAIEFAASNNSVPVVSTKITGLVDNDLLIKMQTGDALSNNENHKKKKLEARLQRLGEKAEELGVGLFVDAEESWMQISIDRLVDEMMTQYNKKKAVVYNTYQLYRHDKLEFLKESYDRAKSRGYFLGAKLVRGAYMDKERDKALNEGYPSPIFATKEETDKSYNEAVRFCVDHYEDLASCNACHNWESNLLQAKLIDEKGIFKNHPHLNFCQLYGMSDNLTFNLAAAGYNTAKYLPYGPVREVVPYLIRRAQENSAVAGDMSRELKLISDEMKRRGI